MSVFPRGVVGSRHTGPAWRRLKCGRVVIGAALVLMLAAVSAAAQGITGTVSGTITDVQGGVMPGATVFLISETQGTRTTPV